MSITAECTACGRKYQAPASMAGKRVRCKQCGNVFALPDVESGDQSQADLDALANLEKSYHSVDATAAGQDTPTGEGDDEYRESAAPLRTGRTNQRFTFPFARELDQGLPLVLTIGGLLWLGSASFSFNQTSAKWLPGLWIAFALFAYCMFVAPLTLAMIHKAGKQLGFLMPASDRFRAFATYLPAFVIACVLWTLGDGAVISLVLGSIIGVLITTVFLWLLFRLQPSEIAPTAGYAMLGFAVGMAVSAGIYFGLNLLLIQTMVSTRSPDLLPASPFGPGMAWITDEQRQEIAAATTRASARPQSAHTVEPELGPEAPPPTPPAPVVTSAAVKSIDIAPIGAPFDEVIRPLTESSFLALSKASGSSATIDLWDGSNWTKRGTAPFTLSADHPDENHFVLSPDGDRLAHIVRFPGLLAQVWSFSQNMASDSTLTGAPELVGFIDAKRLLVRRQEQGKDSLVVQEIDAIQPGKPFDVLKHVQPRGTTLAINAAGTMVAIAAKDGNLPKLKIYDLQQGKEVNNVTIGLDPSWPVAPTGMVFSFDGKQIAILFEQGGAGFIVAYAIDPAKPELVLSKRHIYPAGPQRQRSAQFNDNALAWLPDGKTWLLYGQGIFDVNTSRPLAELGVANVETCRVRSPDIVELTVRGPNSQRQIRVVHLDMEKIATLGK